MIYIHFLLFLTLQDEVHFTEWNVEWHHWVELVRLVLAHDHCRSHLDPQGRTTELELVKRNYKYAAKTLDDIGNGLVIYGDTVFIEPGEINIYAGSCTSKSLFSSNFSVCRYVGLRAIFPTGFIPSPYKIKETFHKGVCPANAKEKGEQEWRYSILQ